MRLFLVIFAVEALAASWIEIVNLLYKKSQGIVEALAASWIEISDYVNVNFGISVEALAASWIEIHQFLRCISNQTSKPLRLRGLKFLTPF